jgi:sodium-independent sulfate anion transporter 11
VLLFRVVKAKGRFLGKVKVHSVVGDHLLEDKFPSYGTDRGNVGKADDLATRNIFLPINHNDGSNPSVDVESPYPGIFIYRFSEGFNYPNANHYTDELVQTIFRETRRSDLKSYPRLGDRPWNEPGPRRGRQPPDRSHLPTLKAIILDFSSVNNVDVTSIQNLIDVRNQLDRYAAPESVQWHLACINNRWTKRALTSAGFGYPTGPTSEFHRWKPIFSVAEIGGSSSAAAAAEIDENRRRSVTSHDIEKHTPSGKLTVHEDQIGSESTSSDNDLQKTLSSSNAYSRGGKTRIAVVHGLNRPFFHTDLTSALQSAIAYVEGNNVRKGVGTEE